MKKVIYVSVNCSDLQNLLKVYQNHENHSISWYKFCSLNKLKSRSFSLLLCKFHPLLILFIARIIHHYTSSKINHLRIIVLITIT